MESLAINDQSQRGTKNILMTAGQYGYGEWSMNNLQSITHTHQIDNHILVFSIVTCNKQQLVSSFSVFIK